VVAATGAQLEVVHRLDHQREPGGPVIAAAGGQPDADGIALRHQVVAVVLDLVNPTGADGGRSAGDGRQGSMKVVEAARNMRVYVVRES
jgi:hypothetical protein